MLRIDVQRRRIPRTEMRERSPKEADIERLIREPCELWDGDRLVLVYDALPPGEAEMVGLLLPRVPIQSGHARTSGLVVTARTFGFQPRVALRRDFCAEASLASEDAVLHRALVAQAFGIAGIYERRNPSLYGMHKAMTDTKAARFRLAGTPFTSGIVNENNPLKYHHDLGNYPCVWSGMVATKQGRQSGGHLALPEYGLGLEIASGSVTLFDGAGLWHGVTPIRLVDEGARRFTAVYYSMAGLWKCETPEQELARIRRLRTEREGRPRGPRPEEGA